jgi:membrane protein implicated in regulation of membrane protease activity
MLAALAIPRAAFADVVSGPSIAAIGIGVVACAGVFVLAIVVVAVLVLRHLSRRRKAAEQPTTEASDETAE